MAVIPGYSFTETIEENGLFLYKAVRESDLLPVLIAVADLNNTKQVKQLEHEFELGPRLAPEWSLKPVTIERTTESIALIFEAFEGISLSTFLNEKPIKLKLFLELAILISSALSKVRKADIIHKDIKPHNILINPKTKEIRISDFGISSVSTSEYLESSTGPVQIEGTLPYMSPEQTGRMNRPLDYRTDMYSLGITFYQMLTGKLPFLAEDPLEWIYNHIARIPQEPYTVSPEIPQAVSDIIMKLMSKLAEDRYQSTEGLIYDLQKCLTQLEKHHRIDSFPLGKKDYSGKFQITQKLYGREKELRVLLTNYDNFSKTGTSEIVTVSGYSGTGKTMLINEFRKLLLSEKSFFLTGKFDQAKREVPYAALADLFKDFIQIIQSRSEEEINKWKQNIQTALGNNGRVITDLLPELEFFIGKQPEVIALPPFESQNRFNMIFEKFARVFSQKEHPLVVFLDDIQWADSASFRLIQKLFTNPDNKFLFLIIAYRDNEVSPLHPLILTLNKIKKTHSIIKEIKLSPLSKGDIEKIITDSLKPRSEDNTYIAEIIYDKTGGNPYFVKHFFFSLYKEKLLKFNSDFFKWEWDIAGIRAKEYTDNVADLMVKKINSLDLKIQNILKLAACIGNKFDKETLEAISSESPKEINRYLNELVDEALISYYEYHYKFLHDQILEVAYSLISKEEHAKVNLKIARFMLSHLSEKQISEQIFDIVNHFNQAVHLITDSSEQKFLCKLNIQAGRKAKDAIAYASARNYLEQARELQTTDSWNINYKETFLLYLDLADCEYLVGNTESAMKLFDFINEEVHSNPDRARASIRKAKLYQVTGNFAEALDVILDALRLFGITLPESQEEIQKVTAEEIRQIGRNMGKQTISDLERANIITDPDIHAMISLLEEAIPTAYNTRPVIFKLLTFKGMNISLQNGIVEETCTIYGFYGILLQAMFEDIPSAFEFLEMTLRINENFGDIKRRGTLLVMYGASINFWGRHIATSRPILEKGFAVSINVGDFLYAGYNAILSTWHLIEEGKTFEYVFQASEKYFSFARQSQNKVLFYVIKEYNQFLLCLKGLTKGMTNFNDDKFSETQSLEVFTAGGYFPGILFHYVMKQQAAFIYQQYHDAHTYSLKADDVKLAIMNLAIQATHHFYYALTLTAIYQDVSVKKQEEYDRILEDKLNKHKQWAENCPENFQNRYALISAEVARIKGKDIEAMHFYEEAIRSSKENGFIQNEAIANELAGCFYKSRGFERIAEVYLREAYSCYKQWGADGKLMQMEKSHRFLKEIGFSLAATLGGISVEQLDLLAVIKASQAISGQIDFKHFISNLMQIVLEQSGAHKAYLLLDKDGTLVMASHAKNVNYEFQVEVFDNSSVISQNTLPISIIQYVKRTKGKVTLDDPSLPNLFHSDDYFIANHPQSIAALPILKQTKLLGILYLENHLFTKAFSTDKILILELLSSQAAISIENAALFQELILSRQQLQDMMDNSSEIIVMKGPDEKYIFINRAFQNLFQVSKEEAINKSVYKFWPKDYADMVTEHDKQVLESRNPITFEENVLLEDGLHTYLTVRFPLLDVKGIPYAVCGIYTDITDRKRTEQEMQRMNRELIRINTDLDNFIYTASHNLRGPVSTLEGLVNILDLNLYQEGEFEEIIKMLKNSLAKFKGAVNDLTDISKVQKLIEKQDVVLNDIPELIEEMKSEMAEMIKESGAEIKTGLLEARRIRFSKESLKRILYNLFSNSIKFRSYDRKLEITISTSVSSNCIILCVSDNAAGISAIIQKRIYSMLTKGYTRGSGIGLYIVKRILDNEGGKMDFLSKEGRGSTFKLYFKK